MSVFVAFSQQLTESFHAELFKLVPEDHILQKIHGMVDFSFIHELVEQFYYVYAADLLSKRKCFFVYNLSDEPVVQETQNSSKSGPTSGFLGLIPKMRYRTLLSCPGFETIGSEPV
ncbi:hypothetical protein PMSM_00005 [Paenibacillus macquariensis subsp. macquariensis]|uniref:Uncharacterized protein n=1 Tax=Paenibacillus macquariensis TaxID=948756 RepID=A0ABY1K2G5_9BACL|nr:hypothetical protein PMSM_00005 [Paenibacillus macquariensis subsp. macquariensis]SIR16844.1 hypothetical protein SAMN05421578_1083 [Paenibacillus macquariensis]